MPSSDSLSVESSTSRVASSSHTQDSTVATAAGWSATEHGWKLKCRYGTSFLKDSDKEGTRKFQKLFETLEFPEYEAPTEEALEEWVDAVTAIIRKKATVIHLPEVTNILRRNLPEDIQDELGNYDADDYKDDPEALVDLVAKLQYHTGVWVRQCHEKAIFYESRDLVRICTVVDKRISRLVRAVRRRDMEVPVPWDMIEDAVLSLIPNEWIPLLDRSSGGTFMARLKKVEKAQQRRTELLGIHAMSTFPETAQETTDVNALQTWTGKPLQPRQCSCCGGDHPRRKCEHWREVCKNCGQRGHMTHMCTKIRFNHPGVPAMTVAPMATGGMKFEVNAPRGTAQRLEQAAQITTDTAEALRERHRRQNEQMKRKRVPALENGPMEEAPGGAAAAFNAVETVSRDLSIDDQDGFIDPSELLAEDFL